MEQIRLTRTDGGAILNCAVRYAMGRRTYMPELVVRELIPVLPQCDDRTLNVFCHDVKGYLEHQEYVMSIPYVDWEDRQLWQEFLSRVEEEMGRRAR